MYFVIFSLRFCVTAIGSGASLEIFCLLFISERNWTANGVFTQSSHTQTHTHARTFARYNFETAVWNTPCNNCTVPISISTLLMKMNTYRHRQTDRLSPLWTFLTYLVHGPESFFKLKGFAASQEIPRILWNPKFHYRSHNCPSSVPNLSQLGPVPIPTCHFQKIHLNIILPSKPGSPKWSLSFQVSPPKPCIQLSSPGTGYMPCFVTS